MKEKMSKKNMWVLIVIVIVLIGISYYAGDKHGQGQVATTGGPGGNYQGGMGANRRSLGGNANGEVLSKDATSITVKMRDGSTRIVLYSPTTQVLKSSSGTIDDVTVGETVNVIGSANSDGSVTAQSVQIRPSMPSTGTPTAQ